MKKESAHQIHTHSLGFTLFELLVVIAIMGIIFFPIILTWQSSRGNQALIASADNFANNIKTVRMYAREAKDSKAWGIARDGENSYKIVSGQSDKPTTVSTQTLESQIRFSTSNFVIWFGIGTGEPNSDQSIELTNPNGKKVKIDIFKTGLIETSKII
jgi:prepilin-type N-terminal cleavage/methylation domain-containing protein